MKKRAFDSEAFYAALDAQRAAKSLTWKDVAGATGLSPSTLTRMARGSRPDVDGLASLLAWSGLGAEAFIRSTRADHATEPETLALISTSLRKDPELSPESAQALEQIIAAAYGQMRATPPTERRRRASSRRQT